MTPSPTLACGILVALLCTAGASAEKAKLVTFAKTYGSYEHVSDPASPDFGRETFALAEGHYDPADARDDDTRSLSFHEVAAPLSQSLVGRGFRPAESEDTADILIVVHRGQTDPARDEVSANMISAPPSQGTGPQSGASMNRVGPSAGSSIPTDHSAHIVRRGNLQDVARKLGYTDALNSLPNARNHPIESQRLDDLLAELSQERHYIVLGAYDARELRNRGRRVLLWETRLSFTATDDSAAERAPTMIEAASVYFGKNTPTNLARSFVSLD